MSKTFKVRRKYHALFEPVNIAEDSPEWDLIYVKYQDLEGYINYEYCGDGTKQNYKMTDSQLVDNYRRI